jgi:hypothetical protein
VHLKFKIQECDQDVIGVSGNEYQDVIGVSGNEYMTDPPVSYY